MRLGTIFRWFLIVVLTLAGVFGVSFAIVYVVAIRDRAVPPATGPLFPNVQTTTSSSTLASATITIDWDIANDIAPGVPNFDVTTDTLDGTTEDGYRYQSRIDDGMATVMIESPDGGATLDATIQRDDAGKIRVTISQYLFRCQVQVNTTSGATFAVRDMESGVTIINGDVLYEPIYELLIDAR